MEEGALSCQAAHLFLPIRYLGAGGFGARASVDPMATLWPWTLTGVLSPASTLEVLEMGRECSTSRKHQQAPIQGEEGTRLQVSSECTPLLVSHPYFVNPSSLKLLITSSFSCLLVFIL